MILDLKCPKCGFTFWVAVPDNISEEDLTEIMTCPCGEKMLNRRADE